MIDTAHTSIVVDAYWITSGSVQMEDNSSGPIGGGMLDTIPMSLRATLSCSNLDVRQTFYAHACELSQAHDPLHMTHNALEHLDSVDRSEYSDYSEGASPSFVADISVPSSASFHGMIEQTWHLQHAYTHRSKATYYSVQAQCGKMCCIGDTCDGLLVQNVCSSSTIAPYSATSRSDDEIAHLPFSPHTQRIQEARPCDKCTTYFYDHD